MYFAKYIYLVGHLPFECNFEDYEYRDIENSIIATNFMCWHIIHGDMPRVYAFIDVAKSEVPAIICRYKSKDYLVIVNGVVQ